MGLDVHNYTPFAPMVVPARDRALRDHWVIAIKGIYRIAPEGAVLDDEQEPPIGSDAYLGEPGRSSLRAKDWNKLALRYNGPKALEPGPDGKNYADHLKEHYEKLQKEDEAKKRLS